jgi:hypothetical protein
LQPDAEGVVYSLDAGGTLKTLSGEPFKITHSSVVKAAYVSGLITVFLEVPHARSPFRLKADRPEFVFKFPSPENAVLFWRRTRKNTRRFAERTASTRKSEIVVDPGLPVDITDFGQHSFRLVPQSQLKPGEYAILIRGSAQAKERKLFTFGVD